MRGRVNPEAEFLISVAAESGVVDLGGGVLGKQLKSGKGPSPRMSSVVMVYYKGMLSNGKVFDDNTRQSYPDAMRLKDLIVGWHIALQKMKVGDKWTIYIPSKFGYGSRAMKGIPKNSTLIFEIELCGIA